MTHQGTTGISPFSPGHWFTPGWPLLLGSSALVATAAWLGMDALRAPVLGLPAGLWTIALIQAAAFATQRLSDPASAAHTDRLLDALRDRFARLVPAIGLTTNDLDDLTRRAVGTIDNAPVHAAPLRVGIALPSAQLAALRASMDADAPRVDWIAIDHANDPSASITRHHLDALIIPLEESGVHIITAVDPRRDAAWHDWADHRPLTFGHVFPMRIDPASVTLRSIDWARADELALVAAIAAAAAALSRSPARLGVTDRLHGRLPALHQDDTATNADPMRRAAEHAIAHLTHRLTALEPRTFAPDAAIIAARAVSAWACATTTRDSLHTRAQAAEAALHHAPDEAEVLLRALAARLASGDEHAAFDLIPRLRVASDRDAMQVHLAFIQSEIETGPAHPMTLGRVAAGICLLAGSTTPDRLEFVRGDLLDDARYAAWLVGRDQDRALLHHVFRACGATPAQSASPSSTLQAVDHPRSTPDDVTTALAAEPGRQHAPDQDTVGRITPSAATRPSTSRAKSKRAASADTKRTRSRRKAA